MTESDPAPPLAPDIAEILDHDNERRRKARLRPPSKPLSPKAKALLKARKKRGYSMPRF